MHHYIIVLKDSRGFSQNWETIASSASKAIMAANELLPGLSIVSVHLKGQW